ncbi:MAG: DUF3137 domain-containing protein [Oscillospiraceae bacterium]|nr:DUF3137 domain-containing protein [Oscillospiraceae bacterium]
MRVEKKKIITNNVVHEVLSEVMEVIDYQPQSHIDEETLLSAALLNPWEQCLGSCYTKAKYKGVNIEFSDVGLLHEGYDSLQVRRKKTFKFKGQWLIIETKKNENWQVTLKERTSSGLIGEKSEFETANKDFNKKFQIQTDRPAALYDFLTARFVVSILKMDEKANARTYICFTNNENGNNRIHVALHNNREMFDFKPLKKFRSDDLPTIKWRIRREIDYVVGVVDEILQNSELF